MEGGVGKPPTGSHFKDLIMMRTLRKLLERLRIPLPVFG